MGFKLRKELETILLRPETQEREVHSRRNSRVLLTTETVQAFVSIAVALMMSVRIFIANMTI